VGRLQHPILISIRFPSNHLLHARLVHAPASLILNRGLQSHPRSLFETVSCPTVLAANTQYCLSVVTSQKLGLIPAWINGKAG
jgi:hypothetical protein